MVTTDLVRWTPVQTFNHPIDVLAFPEIRYAPPRDTCDPRYAACRTHRVACDCREAHMAEARSELLAYARENRRLEEAVDAALALHGRGEFDRCSAPGCLCTYPCPTRNLLAPLSRREQYKIRENA